jgi:hypothetical protein
LCAKEHRDSREKAAIVPLPLRPRRGSVRPFHPLGKSRSPPPPSEIKPRSCLLAPKLVGPRQADYMAYYNPREVKRRRSKKAVFTITRPSPPSNRQVVMGVPKKTLYNSTSLSLSQLAPLPPPSSRPYWILISNGKHLKPSPVLPLLARIFLYSRGPELTPPREYWKVSGVFRSDLPRAKSVVRPSLGASTPVTSENGDQSSLVIRERSRLLPRSPLHDLALPSFSDRNGFGIPSPIYRMMKLMQFGRRDVRDYSEKLDTCPLLQTSRLLLAVIL